MSLPIVMVPVRVINPDWTLEKDPSMVTYYLPEAMRAAEVLMLNINAGGMRCRSVEPGLWHTQDFSIKWFSALYEIVPKQTVTN